MCSFLFTNKTDFDIDYVNEYQQKRGPDYTNVIEKNGYTFIHNLLSITGDFTVQPFKDDNIVAMYNGEIYNATGYKSDGYCLIPRYKEFGDYFTRYLDGEFALVLVNFNKNELLISSDTFRTKPIFIGKDNSGNFAIASYKSAIKRLDIDNIEMVMPNTTNVFNLNTMKSISSFKITEFSIDQYKENYNDWIYAFKKSIKKRIDRLKVKSFYGLSSGYDSGAIACELENQNANTEGFTIIADENRSVLKQRHNLISKGHIIDLTKEEFQEAKKYILNNSEDFKYKDKYKDYNYKKDKATFGLASICNRGKERGFKVYFSGQGADEILSDYGWNGHKIYNHSSFGGKFPQSLRGFFPWHSFFDGTQIQYLNKEEYTAGAYGIETRYPFLDKDLVQEFLWLRPELKNKYYKAPLRSYLKKYNFPFDEGNKIGFRANKNLK